MPTYSANQYLVDWFSATGLAPVPKVDIASAVPAGSNNIGDVDVLSIAAGDNNIGNVDLASAIPAGSNTIGQVTTNIQGYEHARNAAFVATAAIGGERDDTAPVAATEGNVSPVRITAQRAVHANLRNVSGTELIGQQTMAVSVPVVVASDQSDVPVNPKPATSGGLSIFRSLDLDETEEEVKATAGQVYGWYIANTATATRFVKFYNATAANVTVGTTTPVLTFPIPGNSSDDVGANALGTHGIAFGTAITVAATTGVADADVGAPGANDVIINLFYK